MSDRQGLVVNGQEHAYQGAYDRYVRPLLAEFVGVTLFVFIGCLSGQDGYVGEALAHGFLMALLVAVFAQISGGFFNPAVTLGVALSRAIHPALAVGYMVVQVVGGILGAALVRGCLPPKVYKDIHGGIQTLVQIDPWEAGVSPGWGIMIEMLLTTILVFTVLMTSVNPRTKTKLAPLAIGFAIIVDILAGAPLTGASMNPARSFGPAVCASTILADVWAHHYVYWVGPMLGAILAALLYNVLFAEASSRLLNRMRNPQIVVR